MTFFDRLRVGLRRTTEKLGARVEEALRLITLQDNVNGKSNSGMEVLEELLLEADVGVTDFRMELIKRIVEDIIYIGMALVVKFKNKFTL